MRTPSHRVAGGRSSLAPLRLGSGTNAVLAQSAPDYSLVTGSTANEEKLFEGSQYSVSAQLRFTEPVKPPKLDPPTPQSQVS
jgi:hypothetical protein